MPRLSIITPCYYNQDNLPITLPTLAAVSSSLAPDYEVEYVLVDDGSKDQTWAAILNWKSQYPNQVVAVRLSGNFGSYNAILAGMSYATGDVNIIITADLQDPPELIPQMLSHWEKGFKFVVANRMDREESISQKLFSNTYHYLMRRYGIKHIPAGGFDLVLFDKQLREQVVNINEKNTNTIYLLSWLNFPFVSIPYVRRKRDIGKSRWTLRKKIKLFIDSFVAFSFMPIRAISALGFLLAAISLIYLILVLIARFINQVPVEGWTSLMVVLLLVSSFNMVALGIIGEYVWRTLDATRARPPFVIDQVLPATGGQPTDNA